MHLRILIASALVLGATTAWGSPMVRNSPVDAATARVTEIHHKPGHRGGPPWARQRERQPEILYERPGTRRQFCRTTYETVFDRYAGEYVNRPVRSCSDGY